MEVREILEKLYYCREASYKSGQVEQDIYAKGESLRNAEYKLSKYKIGKRIFLGWLLFVVVAVAIGLRDSAVGIAQITGLIAGAIYYFVRKNEKKKEIARIAEEYKKIQEEGKQQVDEIVQEYIDYLTIIPQDYWYTKAIETIIKYFESGRADSIKEALALYDDQVHKWNVENQNQQMLYAQQQQAQQAKTATMLAGAALGAALFNRRD